MAGLDLAGKRVVVWGLGRHGGGLAAASFLAARGAEVAFLDGADPASLGDAARRATARGWTVHHGDGGHPLIAEADLVVASPAIPPRAIPARLLASGRLSSPVALFCAAHAGPRVAVTGTKGKSTTARILGELLGWPVAGNSHEPLLSLLEREGPGTPVVCELSSFQLWQLRDVQPRFDGAVLTRLDVDHLDWHGDAAHYRGSKLALLEWTGRRVMPPALAAELEVAALPPGRWDQGGFATPDGSRICELEALGLLGDHNRDNACLAIGLAAALGAEVSALAAGLCRVRPLPHRLQPVYRAAGEGGGTLTFVDDSIATTPEAAIAGIRAIAGPLAVILGGSDKGADFATLAVAVRERGATACTVGACGPAIGRALAAAGAPHETCGELPTAVARAASLLGAAGGTVLLSPACASFDRFSGYEERGERFLAIARELLPGGTPCG